MTSFEQLFEQLCSNLNAPHSSTHKIEESCFAVAQLCQLKLIKN